MSQKIEQILEVIEEVREKFQTGTGLKSVHVLRVKAGASVANRRGIRNQTVLDKFIRDLRPDIQFAADFDKLLEDWLIQDSNELQNIFLKHKSSRRDEELIRNAFYKASEPEISLAHEFGLDPNDESFKEGKEKFRLHLTKERNRYLVKRAKEVWQQQGGKVCCSACSFSFSQVYGKLGDDFIEAHHVKPISSLTPDTIIKLSDLVPVCSNCHSMLHRHRPWLSIEELREIISSRHT